MLTRIPKVSQTLGHWLSQAEPSEHVTPAAAESQASDGDLPQGAGFREPPPDSQWRNPQDKKSESTHEESQPAEMSSEHWSELHAKLSQGPATPKPAGLTRYRETPGSRRSTKKFRKGIVLDEAG